jgi:hypothetical protein
MEQDEKDDSDDLVTSAENTSSGLVLSETTEFVRNLSTISMFQEAKNKEAEEKEKAVLKQGGSGHKAIKFDKATTVMKETEEDDEDDEQQHESLEEEASPVENIVCNG